MVRIKNGIESSAVCAIRGLSPNAMNMRTVLVLVLSLFIFQASPKLTISANQVVANGRVTVQGSGFTPKRNVSSHLRNPDGTEYPVLPILTDDRGEFTHEIDSRLLKPWGRMNCGSWTTAQKRRPMWSDSK